MMLVVESESLLPSLTLLFMVSLMVGVNGVALQDIRRAFMTSMTYVSCTCQAGGLFGDDAPKPKAGLPRVRRCRSSFEFCLKIELPDQLGCSAICTDSGIAEPA